ncbi:MAG: DUF928 domain-containing protein, partial [Candidatus Brocadiales bacterium]|nr:DUF928 domain-containing protein [Candidatus Brocadiales bacterium]
MSSDQWFIAIVSDREHRSSDILAGGMIRNVPSSSELQNSLLKSKKSVRHVAYAEHGIWYDAIAELATLIQQQSTLPLLHQQRASLLRQV